MDRDTVIKKLEEYAQDFREQLQKNDDSSLQVLASNTRQGVEWLQQTIMNNDRAKSGLQTVKECVEKFENAVKKGDRQMSAKALFLIEEAVQELKQKQTVAEKAGMP